MSGLIKFIATCAAFNAVTLSVSGIQFRALDQPPRFTGTDGRRNAERLNTNGSRVAQKLPQIIVEDTAFQGVEDPRDYGGRLHSAVPTTHVVDFKHEAIQTDVQKIVADLQKGTFTEEEVAAFLSKVEESSAEQV